MGRGTAATQSDDFPERRQPLCVPLRAGEQNLGLLVLADRINGATYTVEELELLKCIGDQITSVAAESPACE